MNNDPFEILKNRCETIHVKKPFQVVFEHNDDSYRVIVEDHSRDPEYMIEMGHDPDDPYDTTLRDHDQETLYYGDDVIRRLLDGLDLPEETDSDRWEREAVGYEKNKYGYLENVSYTVHQLFVEWEIDQEPEDEDDE